MKITLNISDNILLQTKRFSREERVTIGELVEEGLELVLAKHKQKHNYRAKPVTFQGEGLSQEFKGASWHEIRDAAYVVDC